MPRKVTPRISRGAEPDEQPSRYGLRKRTAHRMVADGNSLGDARRQSLAKRTKRTPTDTRAQSSTSRGIVKRKTKVSSVVLKGRAKRNKNKLWLAEAIREENDMQYLIEYEPVSEGAQREISWQPKHNANAALARDWEERKMASAHEKSNAECDNDPALTKKEDGARRRRSLMAYGGQPPNPITDHRPASARPCVKVGGNRSTTAENNHRCDDHEIRDDMATKVKSGESQLKYSQYASSTVQHLESPASVQHLRTPNEKNSVNAMIADDSRKLRSSPVDAATAYILQSRKDCTSVQDVYGAQPDSYGRGEGLKQVAEDHVAKGDGHGRPSPRPGTSISTILSQAPSTISNINRDNESATFGEKDSRQASPRTLAHVEVSKNRDPGVSGAVSGKLASAREQLRLLLRGPGRRFRKSFPPSP